MNDNKQAIESEEKGGQVIEQFTRPDSVSAGEIGPKIKRGRFDSLELFEVSESELSIIESGSPSSIYLNFAIFLISIAFSFITTLLTVDLTQKIILFTIFVVICTVGFLIGIFLLILWYRNKNEFKEILKKIRDRMKD